MSVPGKGKNEKEPAYLAPLASGLSTAIALGLYYAYFEVMTIWLSVILTMAAAICGYSILIALFALLIGKTKRKQDSEGCK